ncbi:phage tail protein [Leeia aquatica]|uniref:Phage tail protein n=1 Tax=Leeia aquatica TaxID=2725557 RepID=A0A847S341_9NEIS|nr:phage tail protein [Leeia aquatica]NLR73587.1 phage tail protein [Leeia aquatica]
MFALLGDVQFDLITYFDSFESQYSVDYAEHALIEGKPRLQRIADQLDEIRIQLSFHIHFCDPEQELTKLRRALSAHQAMALVLGNGDYKGWFVLTELTATSKQTDQSGTLLALEANLTLREYVGDKKNPLPPPAVQPRQPPTVATSRPVNLAAPGIAIGNAVGQVRTVVRQVVSLARQAQSTIRVLSDAADLVRQLKTNPAAAIKRLPRLLDLSKQAVATLEKLAPAVTSLSLHMPESTPVLQAIQGAIHALRNTQAALASSSISNLAVQIDYISGQARAAGRELAAAGSTIDRLAGNIITRGL